MLRVANTTNPESGLSMARRAVCLLLIGMNLLIGSLGAHAAERVLSLAGTAVSPHAHRMQFPDVRADGCGVQRAVALVCLKAHIARSRQASGVVFQPEVTQLTFASCPVGSCRAPDIRSVNVSISTTYKRYKRATS